MIWNKVFVVHPSKKEDFSMSHVIVSILLVSATIALPVSVIYAVVHEHNLKKSQKQTSKTKEQSCTTI